MSSTTIFKLIQVLNVVLTEVIKLKGQLPQFESTRGGGPDELAVAKAELDQLAKEQQQATTEQEP